MQHLAKELTLVSSIYITKAIKVERLDEYLENVSIRNNCFRTKDLIIQASGGNVIYVNKMEDSFETINILIVNFIEGEKRARLTHRIQIDPISGTEIDEIDMLMSQNNIMFAANEQTKLILGLTTKDPMGEPLLVRTEHAHWVELTTGKPGEQPNETPMVNASDDVSFHNMFEKPKTIESESKDRIDSESQGITYLGNKRKLRGIKKASRFGYNGKIALWAFLLGTLMNPEYMNYISWVSEDGTFVFRDAEKIAKLWGKVKGNENMNYEKMSRSLRYYEKGGVISKVRAEFQYRFMPKIKHLTGFTIKEIQESKHLQ